MANFGKKTTDQAAPAFGKRPASPQRRVSDGPSVPQSSELSAEAMAFLNKERAGHRSDDPQFDTAARAAYEAPASRSDKGMTTAGKPVSGLRILSYLIDTMIISVPFFIIMWPSLLSSLEAYSAAAIGGVSEAKAQLELMELFAWHALVRCAYSVGMEATKQATLGKMAVGIVVTNKHGEKPGLFTVIMRNTIGRAALNLIPLCMGYFMLLFDKNKKGLHDMISGSMVCKKDKSGQMATAEIFA